MCVCVCVCVCEDVNVLPVILADTAKWHSIQLGIFVGNYWWVEEGGIIGDGFLCVCVCVCPLVGQYFISKIGGC